VPGHSARPMPRTAPGGLWGYASDEWLTYRSPTADRARSRWPLAPHSLQVQPVTLGHQAVGLERLRSRAYSSANRVVPRRPVDELGEEEFDPARQRMPSSLRGLLSCQLDAGPGPPRAPSASEPDWAWVLGEEVDHRHLRVWPGAVPRVDPLLSIPCASSVRSALLRALDALSASSLRGGESSGGSTDSSSPPLTIDRALTRPAARRSSRCSRR